MEVRSVAILGAGSAGLAAAKYLLAEKKFSKIYIYEQRATTGGIWNTGHLHHDPGFGVPRTAPTGEHEYAVVESDTGGGGGTHVELVSPVYDNLETNIPHGLMNYTDLKFPDDTALFPEHATVLKYIQQYGKDVESLVSFETQVRDVRKVSSDTGKPVWKVETKDLKSGAMASELYDAVVVASGHYSDPFVPAIPGIKEFDAAHPGVVVHSKFYRRPEQFKGKKVIVVGNSASGIDISNQISSASQLPVLISEKASPDAALPPPTSWSRHVGEITELLPAARGVRLSTGHVEEAVDAVVFCTGYLYSFPFLQGLEPTVLAPDGSYTDHLWEHVLYSSDPSLAFLVIPKRIVPFPLAEAQMAVVARMWAGRLPVPTKEDMDAWVERRVRDTPPGARHTLSYPEDVNYINRLFKLSQEAVPNAELGLENNGAGKIPPYWDEEKSWVRSKIFPIKVASRELGDRRKDYKTLKQLGFDFEAWKAEQGVLQ